MTSLKHVIVHSQLTSRERPGMERDENMTAIENDPGVRIKMNT